VHHLQAIDQDLRNQMEVDQLNTVLKEKLELKQALQLIGSADLNTLQAQQHDFEKQIDELTSELQKATTHKSNLQREQAQLKQYLDMRVRIHEVIQKKRQLNKDGLETLRRQALIQLIRDLQSALAKVEDRIGTAGQQASIVQQHLKTIEASERQEKAWAILVKELSPTEGLIAEGQLGFIRNFVLQMNTLIASVWTYRLEIQSCELVEGESIDLDYRFPFIVEHEDEPIADVSLGSSGMLEIFDLAFQMTALQHLRLQDGPLFLDELGKTMDAVHKAEVANVVKTITEQETFSQVFMISHDFFQYGALSNAEICLLNSLNVMAPTGEVVNQHVEMS
jgi:hypothetical protein